jgi:hypothetical protein
MLSDRGSKPGALVVIVALPIGRFRSSNRPSAPLVAVTLPIATVAPFTTAPVVALTRPETAAVAAGPLGSLPPHAAARSEAARASARAGVDLGAGPTGVLRRIEADLLLQPG